MSKLRKIGEGIIIPTPDSSLGGLPDIVFKLDGKFYEEMNRKKEIPAETVIQQGITVITFKKKASER